MATTTVTKSTVGVPGYDVAVDGTVVGKVYRSGNSWRYTVTREVAEAFMATRPWNTMRDVVSGYGGATRRDAVKSVVGMVEGGKPCGS